MKGLKVVAYLKYFRRSIRFDLRAHAIEESHKEWMTHRQQDSF
jgi:hypothetical protein